MRATGLADGAIAGAVGSVALNMVSYLDMVVRARPASSTPEKTAGRLAGVAHVDLGPEDRAANRRSGLGPCSATASASRRDSGTPCSPGAGECRCRWLPGCSAAV